jgi:sodium-dependent dicarboxylate transporter 2/3/5
VNRARVALWLGLVLGGVVLAAPAPADLPPAAQRLGAVTALMACWWIGEALPIAATSLLPLLLFPLLAIQPVAAVSAQYGDPVVFLFLGAFLIALSMERWGLHRRIALVLVEALGTSPQRLVLGFLVATAALSMWMNNTAATLMMLPVGVSVVEHLAAGAHVEGLSAEKARRAAERSLGAALMLGIAYGASLGGMGTLVGTAPNLILVGAAHELLPGAPEIGFLPWMALGLPVTACLVALCYPILLRFAPETPLARFRFGAAGGDTVAAERRRLGSMSQGERRVLVAFATAALLWIFRAPLELGGLRIPGWSELLPQPRFVGDATVALAVGLSLFLFTGRGTAARPGGRAPLLDWKTVQERVPWGVLLLMGGGFALAGAFEATGLARWLAGRLESLAAAPLPGVVGGVSLFTTLLSELASNTATATLLMPILAATASAIGAPPLVLMIPATLAASCGFALPIATPPNAIVYGTGWISLPRMAAAGLVLDLAGVVVITTLCLLLVPGLFG